MDTQAVNSVGNPIAPTPQSPSKAGTKAVSTPAPKSAEDSVDLSSRAQVLSKKGGQTSSNSEQRKFSVTENNDVVMKVIDPETREVVKSIPSEKEIQLKSAIRDGISNITE